MSFIRKFTYFLDESPPINNESIYWNKYLKMTNPYKNFVFSKDFLEEDKENTLDHKIYIPKSSLKMPKKELTKWFPNSWLKINNSLYPIYVRELDKYSNIRKTISIPDIISTRSISENKVDSSSSTESEKKLKIMSFTKKSHELQIDEKLLIDSVENIPMLDNDYDDGDGDYKTFNTFLELKNNVKIYIELKKTSNNTYRIYFYYRKKNIDYDAPYILFQIHNNRLHISWVLANSEKGIGFCGIMIQFLMELVEHWIRNYNLIIKKVTLENISYGSTGNISGTICYIKYIGKYYPFFKVRDKNDIYVLTDYLNNNYNWENILKDIGILYYFHGSDLGKMIPHILNEYYTFMRERPKRKKLKTPSKTLRSSE